MDLKTFFQQNSKAALAFSGGVDSAYLLYAAAHYGAEVRAYYVKTSFQPQFELEDARRLAEELKVTMRVIEIPILENQVIAENPVDRCYHCKKAIFEAILRAAREEGFTVLLDGTNASDEEEDRPGMRALRELAVRSPLRECGITKEEVRRLSREAGLFTWNKPAYACLATRILAGERITEQKLAAVEAVENYLFSLGFTDFRVRKIGDGARLQLPESQLERALEYREKIVAELKKYYCMVLLDLETRG